MNVADARPAHGTTESASVGGRVVGGGARTRLLSSCSTAYDAVGSDVCFALPHGCSPYTMTPPLPHLAGALVCTTLLVCAATATIPSGEDVVVSTELVEYKVFESYCGPPTATAWTYPDTNTQTSGQGFVMSANDPNGRKACFEQCQNYNTFGILAYRANKKCYCATPDPGGEFTGKPSTIGCQVGMMNDASDTYYYTPTYYRVPQKADGTPYNVSQKTSGCDGTDCGPYPTSNQDPLTWLENQIVHIPGCTQVNMSLLNAWNYVLSGTCFEDVADASKITDLVTDGWNCNLRTSGFSTALSYAQENKVTGVVKSPRVCVKCQNASYLKTSANPGWLYDSDVWEESRVYVYGLNKCVPCQRGKYQDALMHGHTACKDCAAGQYAPTIFRSSCLPCPIGTAQPASAQSSCTTCPAGQYSDQTGQTSCSTCPAGSSTTHNISTIVSTTACFMCPHGQFQTTSVETGQHVCAVCPVGRANAIPGQTECVVCDRGFARHAGQTSLACVECAEGTFADETELENCKACQPGRFANTTRLHVCHPCLPGDYGNTPGRTSCDACPPGRHNPGSAQTSCTFCAAGRFNDAFRQRECQVCPDGRYQPVASTAFSPVLSCASCAGGQYAARNATHGTVACTKCGRGESSTNPDDGTESRVQCFPCARGRFQDQEEGAECKACGSGDTADSRGQLSCTPCTPGRYAKNTTYCAACPKAQFAGTSGHVDCPLCRPGTFGNETGLTACYACPVGRHQNNYGIQSCKACRDGQYANTTGNAACTACPAGQFSSEKPLRTTCDLCAKGYFQANPGQSGCNPCGLVVDGGVRTGRYGNAEGLSACINCEAGKFNDNVNASFSCQWCPMGRRNPQVGGDQLDDCLDCAEGKYGRADRTGCSDCAEGKHQPARGRSNCTDCPMGQYSESSGQPACQACPEGKHGPSSGQTSVNGCVACVGGQYAPRAGAAACSECTRGKYSDSVAGSTACTLCNVGFYAAVAGMSVENTTNGDCTACPTQGVSFPDRTNCSYCQSWQYNTGTACQNCTRCAVPGFARNGCGGNQPGLCVACNNETGNYLTEADRNAPISNDGSVLPFAVCQTCPPCPTGTERVGALSTGTNASVACGRCVQCPSGTYNNDADGNGKCKTCSRQCAVSTRQYLTQCGEPSSNPGSCTDCPAGKFKDPEKIGCTACEACPAGAKRVLCSAIEGKGQCELCAIGQFKDHGGTDTECTSCPGCPVGEQRNEDGASGVPACAALGSETGGTCVQCPAGKYKHIAGVYLDRCKNCELCVDKFHTLEGCGSGSKGTCVEWGEPVITGVTGAAVTTGSATKGGALLVISGENLMGALDAKFAYMPVATDYRVTYGPPDAVHKYTAVCDENPIEKSQRIVCQTTAGVGANHSIQVTLVGKAGARTSSVFPAKLSYLPPVLESFELVGKDPSVGGTTAGNEILRLKGRNFGNDASVVSVLYGRRDAPAASKYTAVNCTIQPSNTDDEGLECRTAPGVGKDLEISVFVDGQQSVQPTFSYGRPVIDRLQGTALTNANTDGGERVTLTGKNFGPSAYRIPKGGVHLRRRVGSDEVAYVAKQCNITQNSKEIQCLTPPGVARDLQWDVVIAEQASAPSTDTLSYGQPSVTSLITNDGHSSLRSDGSTQIEISGDNLGLQVKAGFRDPARTISYMVVYGAEAVTPSTSASEGSYLVSKTFDIGPENDKLLFTPPELDTLPVDNGAPANTPLYLVLGVSSHPLVGSAVTFEASGTKRMMYQPPIVNAVKKEVLSDGTVQITLEGQNFCKSTRCGSLGGAVSGSNAALQTSIVTWSHTKVVFLTSSSAGSVYVQVGKTVSLTKQWTGGIVVMGTMLPATVILNTAGQYRSASDGGVFQIINCKVNGDNNASVKIVFDPLGKNQECSIDGSKGCKIAIASSISGDFLNSFHNISVLQSPVGEGRVVRVALRYDSVDSATTATVSYGEPFIQSIEFVDGGVSIPLAGAVLPTHGGKIILHGRNFGVSPAVSLRRRSDNKFVSRLPCTSGNAHTELNCTVPRGSGTGYEITIDVGGQSLPQPYDSFGYSPPAIVGMTPTQFATGGGAYVYVRGTNLCTNCQNNETVQNVSVYTCAQSVSRTALNLGSLAQCHLIPQVFGTPTLLFFQMNPGVGKNLYLAIKNGYDSVYASPLSTTVSYQAPVIGTMSPSTGPTKGSTAEAPIIVSLRGNNFGSVTDPCAVFWAGGASPLTLIYHNDSMLQFYLPEGQGRDLHVRVQVGVAADAQTAEKARLFSYQAPTVVGLKPDIEYQSCVVKQSAPFLNGTGAFKCTQYNDRTSCNTDSVCEWLQQYPTGGCSVANRESVEVWQERLRKSKGTAGRLCRPGKEASFVLLGTNFGKTGLAVAMYKHENPGEITPLQVLSQSHTEARLSVPAGSGVDYRLLLTALDQPQVAVDPSVVTFRYHPPVPTGIVARDDGSRINALGKEVITIKGDNFGGKLVASKDVKIWINSKPCLRATWLPVGTENGLPFLRCETETEMLVGPLSMVISVAGVQGYKPAILPRPFLWMLATSTLSKMDVDVSDATMETLSNFFKLGVANSICKKGVVTRADGTSDVYHGAPGELCETCPTGGICLANKFVDPAAKLGFFREKLDLRDTTAKNYKRVVANNDVCQGRRTLFDSSLKTAHPGVVRREYCYELASCVPPEACTGFNGCAEGYTYALEGCQAWEKEHGRTKCFTHDDCRRRSGRSKAEALQVCTAEHPEDCARCVVSAEDEDPNATYTYIPSRNESLQGYCECTPPPRCELCTINTHFRLDNRCESCPGNPVFLAVAIIMAIVVFAAVAYWLNKRNFNLAFLSIGVDYFQVVALYTSAGVRWPASLTNMLRYLRIFNIDVDILAPECAIPSFDYETKWWGTMVAPLVAWGIITLWFAGMQMVQTCSHRSNNKLLDSFVSTFIVVFYYGYVILVKRAMEVFDCHPRAEKPDGADYAKFTSEKCGRSLCRCYDSDHLQSQLVGPAVVFLCIYSVGFPLVLWIFLRCNKVLIKEDQLLRAAETGDTPETNVNAFHIRKRYSQMYYHFRPGKIYWIIYILLRKGAISVVGMVLAEFPSLQLAVTVLILFVAYVMQVKHEPYMSTSQRLHVLADHKRKVMAGDEKHKLLAERIKSALEFKRVQLEEKKKKKTQSRKKRRSVVEKGMDTLREKDYAHHDYFFNFNSVEQTLLTCAIIVCMAGIIFDSEVFRNPKTPQHEQLKDLAGYFVFMVLLFSMFYYFLVFVTEVSGFSPKWLMKLCSDKKTEHDKDREDMAHRRFSEINPMGRFSSSGEGRGLGSVEMADMGKLAELRMQKLTNENEELSKKLANHESRMEEYKFRSQKNLMAVKRRGHLGANAEGVQINPLNPKNFSPNPMVLESVNERPKRRKKKIEFKAIDSGRNARGESVEGIVRHSVFTPSMFSPSKHRASRGRKTPPNGR